MFVVVEMVFFLGEEGECASVYGPYASESDANLIVEQMRRLDRERDGSPWSNDYSVQEVEMF